MKKEAKVTKVQIVNIFMAIVIGIYFFVPWLETEDGKFNVITYLMRVYTHGFPEAFRQTFFNGIGGELTGGVAGGTVFTAQLFYYLMLLSAIVQCAVCVYVITSCLGHQRIKLLSISAWIYGVFFVFFYFQSLESITFLQDGTGISIPTSVHVYCLLLAALVFVWILLVKMLEQWDTAATKAKEERIKRIEDKKERRRRLAFAGRYSKLYYRVLWKDLLYRKKDFLFLVLAELLCTVFLFAGGGIYSMLSAGYGEDYGLLGLGLIEIIRDFMVVISLLSVFLFSVVFSFYRRNRMRSSGVYETLGIRSRTLYASWIGELVFSIVSVLAVVFFVGDFLLELFRVMMERMFPQMGRLGHVSSSVYFGVAAGIIIIFIIAVVISREMDAGKTSVDARNAVVQNEKIPGRLRYLGMGMGSIMMVLCVWFFSQRRMAESIWIFGVFLISMAVFISNSWIILLDYQKQKKESYLKNLPVRHMILHRYKTTVMYVSLLTVIHICVMVFFGVRFISNQIATEPEKLFPYDYVCLANTGDGEFFEELEEECEAELLTFPMVRVSTMDGTEATEDFRPPIHPQGQHIGISESAYRELSVLNGDTVQKNLGLDADGAKVYIIYQQVRDAWKKTSIITGRELTSEEAQADGGIEESATKLQLVNIQAQYREKAEQILDRFENQYEKEQRYDPLVRRVYDKAKLVKQRGMEHRLEIFLNGFIMMMLLAVSLFLLLMKVRMELPEMKKRYLFMERMGMRQKERILAEKKEIARFVYIPLVISVPIIAIFTVVLFRLRMFSVSDMQHYGRNLVILIAGYVVIQLVNLKWMQHTVVKQIEGDIER